MSGLQRGLYRPPTNEIALNLRKTLNQLKQLTSELQVSIANAHAVYQSLEATMAGLEHQGLTHAKGYWRERKYFCLYSPSQRGERRVFRYVGCNPEKVRATQAAMRRAIEYNELVAQIAHLEDFAEQCCRNLVDVLCTLRAFDSINSLSKEVPK